MARHLMNTARYEVQRLDTRLAAPDWELHETYRDHGTADRSAGLGNAFGQGKLRYRVWDRVLDRVVPPLPAPPLD